MARYLGPFNLANVNTSPLSVAVFHIYVGVDVQDRQQIRWLLASLSTTHPRAIPPVVHELTERGYAREASVVEFAVKVRGPRYETYLEVRGMQGQFRLLI